MRQFLLITLLLAIGSGAAAAQYLGPAPNTPYSSQTIVDTAALDRLLVATEPEKVFHMDDVFNVQVYGVKDFNLQRRVGADGLVSLPLIGMVEVRGRTIEQVEQLIAGELRSRDLVQDAQVTVTIMSQPSLTVTVAGEVAKPGIFPALGRHTLSDYLAQAGGLQNTASSTVTLIRPGISDPLAVPIGPDPSRSRYAQIPIFPGDEIKAAKIGVVYVVGALKIQGAYPLKNTTPTTVMDAIAMAGGIGFEAAYGDARIYRTVGDHRVEEKVNVSKIMSGKAEDVPLIADDIVFVPTNKMKAAVKNGGAALAVSLASAYIYVH